MFTRVALPTPFPVGDVNAYLAGRTVIDPGPATEGAWTALTDGLAERGLEPGDVAQVLLTHGHPDHFGLADRLRAAGADVVASDPTAEAVADYAGRLADERSYFEAFLARCGIDRERAATVASLTEGFLPYVEDVTVDRVVTTGETVTVDGRTLAVDETTGHAPGELRFTVAEGPETTSVVGDHVLPDHTPNPFLQPPPEPGAPRPRVLPAFNDSLRALADDPVDRLLPGHGDPITAPADRIRAILDHHEARTERVRALLDGPTTPATVVEGLFPDLDATDLFAGVSEAVGHLDVLEERGVVRQLTAEETIRYERLDATDGDTE